MAAMYQLPVYMPEDTKVQPLDVMYSLPNYHAKPNSIQNDSDELVIVDPVALIEKRQQELILQLNKLNGKLNDLLKSNAPKVAAAKAPAAPAAAPATEGGKKDKDAKKEARKAAKADAKSKVDAGGAPASKAGAKASGKPWILHEDRPSTETGQSLTPCTKQVLVNFKQESVKDLTLTILAVDLPWIEALAKIGQKRDVLFKGKVSNNVSKPKTTVTVNLGDKFGANGGDWKSSMRTTVWKVLGASLGLYAYDFNQAVNATHQNLWLQKANQVLEGKESINDVIRAVSQFLSSFDSLGAQFNVTLADIVIRSLSPSTNNANNVELWITRVNASF